MFKCRSTARAVVRARSPSSYAKQLRFAVCRLAPLRSCARPAIGRPSNKLYEEHDLFVDNYRSTVRSPPFPSTSHLALWRRRRRVHHAVLTTVFRAFRVQLLTIASTPADTTDTRTRTDWSWLPVCRTSVLAVVSGARAAWVPNKCAASGMPQPLNRCAIDPGCTASVNAAGSRACLSSSRSRPVAAAASRSFVVDVHTVSCVCATFTQQRHD